MGEPVKIQQDSKINGGSATLADLDPHVSASATGQFAIAFTEPVSASETHVSMLVEINIGYLTFDFTVSAAIDESDPSVQVLKNGSAVIVYRSEPDATGNADIRARLLHLDTNFEDIGPEFVVNLGNTAGTQERPEVVELNGRLAFAWIDSASGQIKAAVANLAGEILVQNITVSTTPSSQSGVQFGLGLTALSNGNFVVSWRDDAFVSHVRIVGPFGNFVTGDVATAGTGSTDVTELADGRILLTYFKFGGLGHFGLILNEDGSPSAAELQITTSSGLQAVTALLDGRFMVAYDQGGDVFARIMNPDGTPDTDPFRINDDTTGTQRKVHLATNADGLVIVAWEDSRTGGGDIYYTIYDPRETGVQIVGTGYGDRFEGSRFADQFFTGGGNDSVNAGNGNDIAYAGDGNDVVYGEGGNDIIFGGNGNDYISGEFFTNGAGNDKLDGGLGADRMVGGKGNDLFIVDNALDEVDEFSDGGIDRVASSVSFSLAGTPDVENLTLLGAASINGTGNALKNVITGNAAANVLNGGGNVDRLVGLNGNDTFIVDTTIDIVVEAAGVAAGTLDRVYFTGLAGQTYLLPVNVERLTLQGLAATNGTGNALSNTIAGNSANNILDGAAGNDRLFGLNGMDTLLGGVGNDTLDGGGGNDLLNGGIGIDALTGGANNDAFLFNAPVLFANRDTITDFVAVNDTMRLENAVFTSLTPGPLHPTMFKLSTQAKDANDFIQYNKATGALIYDSNGSGAGGAVQFATLSTKPTISHLDFQVI